MSKKQRKAHKQFNMEREKRGLPILSRREFVRAMAAASAGLSVPFLNACSDERTNPTTDTGSGGLFQAEQSGTTDTSTQLGGTGGGGQIGSATGGQQVAGGGGRIGSITGGEQSAGGGGQMSGGTGGLKDSGTDGGPGTGGAGVGGIGPDSAAGGSSAAPGNAVVGITRNADTSLAVATAVELAGGLNAIKQGETVVIKPNISTPGRGVFTSLPVIRGIVEAVAAHTDRKNITIGECTAMGLNTRANAARAGYLDLVDELGINFLPFDEGEYVLFKDPKWTHIKTEKKIPVSLRSFNHFISAPILKNHQMVDVLAPGCDVQFTCCMKLFVGILPYAGAGSRSDPVDDIHTVDLGEKVAELGCIVPDITMCVVDALDITVVGGPTGLSTVNSGLILASSDRVACDSLAFAVLKTYAKKSNVNLAYVTQPVWTQSQIKRGGELGLGIADPSKITIVDKDVDNIAEIKAQWV
ncbi:MAG: DUF362 domain-containing protein [Deltaproteobacteria bacterium]|nr:DUF362 domain-containing protein [Deltaproteobacteria bacterium]